MRQRIEMKMNQKIYTTQILSTVEKDFEFVLEKDGDSGHAGNMETR
jgi:hypothetical protein